LKKNIYITTCIIVFIILSTGLSLAFFVDKFDLGEDKKTEAQEQKPGPVTSTPSISDETEQIQEVNSIEESCYKSAARIEGAVRYMALFPNGKYIDKIKQKTYYLNTKTTTLSVYKGRKSKDIVTTTFNDKGLPEERIHKYSNYKVVNSFTYDAYGNLVNDRWKSSSKYGSDTNKSYRYNSRHLKIQTTYTDLKESKYGHTETYIYNELDQLIKATKVKNDGKTTVQSYAYDEKGRFRLLGGGGSEMIYDQNDNLIEMRGKDYSIHYSYDHKGQMIKSIFVDQNGKRSIYIYENDANGNKIKTTSNPEYGKWTQLQEYKPFKFH